MKMRAFITARPVVVFGKTRWKFEMPSILHPGTLTASINTWSSKAGALRAGRREWGNVEAPTWKGGRKI